MVLAEGLAFVLEKRLLQVNVPTALSGIPLANDCLNFSTLLYMAR